MKKLVLFLIFEIVNTHLVSCQAVTFLSGWVFLMFSLYFPESYQEGHSGGSTRISEYWILRCLVSCHHIAIVPVDIVSILFFD
jgi:hypothetical protein